MVEEVLGDVRAEIEKLTMIINTGELVYKYLIVLEEKFNCWLGLMECGVLRCSRVPLLSVAVSNSASLLLVRHGCLSA